ncbi:MAG: hypothetical protein ACERKV_10785 [Clostridiaceae bacterium]
MNPALWVSMWLPLFIVFLGVISARKRNIIIAKKLKREKGERKMSNELIKNYVGYLCTISQGSFGTAYQKVRIVEVVDNWIRVEKNGKVDLINIDYIQNIKILEEK